MPLTVVWPPRDHTLAHDLQPFVQAVRDVLGETEEPLDVRFETWPGEDGRTQYVCKVEGPPRGPFAMEEQWRWWSPIVSEPDALGESLREAVARRRGGSVASVSTGRADASIRSAAG